MLRSTVKAPSTEKDSDGIPLLQRAANSIVAEYLKRCNFEYTLSTFLPESGTTLEKVFLFIKPCNIAYKTRNTCMQQPMAGCNYIFGHAVFVVRITYCTQGAFSIYHIFMSNFLCRCFQSKIYCTCLTSILIPNYI